MWIQFAFDAHHMYANSIHIWTELSVKRPEEEWKQRICSNKGSIN